MRYEKADNVLQLALEMQAAHTGLTLQDIQERFGISKRTAMRMKDSVLRNFPQADEVPSDEKTKRWRIPPGVLNQLVSFSADELADLEAAISLLNRENLGDHANSLEGLAAKLKALMKPDVARRVEPDLEALIEAEGLAMRPGPRPKIRTTVLEDLREAIKGCRKVTIRYRNRGSGRRGSRVICPYGFLYGHRHYLVAYDSRNNPTECRKFILSNIEDTKLTDEMFDRDENFSLREYAARAFGLYHDKPVDVAWRFLPGDAAKDAAEFQFHPDQELEKQKDGSLIVRFRASGALEMAWHLYMWGDQVEVLEPKHLADMVNGNQPSWPGLP